MKYLLFALLVGLSGCGQEANDKNILINELERCGEDLPLIVDAWTREPDKKIAGYGFQCVDKELGLKIQKVMDEHKKLRGRIK